MKQRNRQRIAVGICAMLAMCHTVAAQQRIFGKVLSKDGAATGAVITLTNTNLGAVADSAGAFQIDAVPVGAHDMLVNLLGYESYAKHIRVARGESLNVGDILLKTDTHVMQGVTVTGAMDKGSAKEAVHLTRTATRLVTVLSAEGIAKMPDKNVAEAVQRVAGVKLERNKGEGSTVSLRGTPTDWTATLINGDRLPTSDEDDPSRTFQFLVFPANLVDYIFVTRTVTPDFEADNIGGAINFQTVGPPDKRKLSVNLGSGLNAGSGKPLYDLNFTYGNISKNKKLAYVLSGSYYQRPYTTDAMRLVYGSNYNHAINRLELKDYFGDRTTIGTNAAVTYKPNSRLTLGAHFMHGRSDDDKWQYKTTFNWSDGSGQRMRDIGTHGLLQRRLYGGDLTATWKLNDKMTLDAKAASYYSSFQYGPFPYGKGDERNGYLNYQFISSIEPPFHFNDLVTTDFSGKIPSDPNAPTYPFKLIGADNPYGNGDGYRGIQPQPNYVPTLSQYTLEAIYSEVNHTYEQDPIQAQLNYTWQYNDKLKLKAGGKFRYKEGSREISKYEWILNTANINGLTIPLDRYELQDAPRNGRFLSTQSDAYRGMLLPFMTQGQMSSFINNLGDTLVGRQMDKYNSEYAYWVGSKYKYNEAVSSGYAMAEWAPAPRWKLVGGIRLEHTHFNESSDTLTGESHQHYSPDSSTISFYYEPATQTVSRSYLAILPSLNATFNINEKSDLRLAVSRTFHRPNFEETKPGFAIIRYEDLEFKFGNPNLKPTYSLNFDATWQRYWGNKGLATFGVYYKHVTDHIFARVAADGDPVSGILYKYYENAGTSYVMGAEASIDKQLDFLKGFWSGFGLNANFTYSYSRMQVPGRPNGQAMTEQTPLLYNIALYYDRGRVAARIGLNYTGAYLKELNLAAVNGIGILHKDTDYDLFVGELYSLDFQASFKVTKRFTAYVEANNLLNAPYKTYIGQEWRPRRIEYYGQRLQAGVKFDL